VRRFIIPVEQYNSVGVTFSGCVKLSRTPRQKHIKEREIPEQLKGATEMIILKWMLKIWWKDFH